MAAFSAALSRLVTLSGAIGVGATLLNRSWVVGAPRSWCVILLLSLNLRFQCSQWVPGTEQSSGIAEMD
jgi:hypothetical protein